MNTFVEERIACIRLARGLRGFPEWGDTWGMVDWLAGCISVRQTDRHRGICVHRADGGANIILPRHASEDEITETLVEEMAHALLGVGLAQFLRQAQDPLADRLAKLWELKEEANARQFVASWFLPMEEVLAPERR